MDDIIHDALREWARGMTTTAAATELLIRAGFAKAGSPWVHIESDPAWIDFASIPDLIGGLSGGQQRLLRIAASIGGDSPVGAAGARGARSRVRVQPADADRGPRRGRCGAHRNSAEPGGVAGVGVGVGITPRRTASP